MDIQEGLATKDSFEYSVLFQKHVAERLEDKTGEILKVIINNSNPELTKLLCNFVDENPGSKICLEDLDSYIDAHLIDSESEEISIIGITDKKNLTCQTVEPETYTNLKELCVDFNIARADAESTLSKAI